MPRRVFEDIAQLQALIGQEVGSSDWSEVTQPLIDAFAVVIQDHQWIHVDQERARVESPYGTTIAHGFLTLSLVSQLHAQAVRIECGFARGINYGFNRVRFPAAVPSGARIRTHSILQGFDEIDGGVQLTWTVTVEIEGQSKPAVVAEWLVRLYR